MGKCKKYNNKNDDGMYDCDNADDENGATIRANDVELGGESDNKASSKIIIIIIIVIIIIIIEIVIIIIIIITIIVIIL